MDKLTPEASAWLAETIARNKARFSGFFMEGEGGDGGTGADGGQGGDGGSTEQTFTQADVDRLIGERLKRERDATKAKYGDYDDLKAKAEGAKTAEDRIAELEKATNEANAKALRADIANQHGISAEDRDLFLTGTDAETLTAQAERLAEREEAVKQGGNYVGKEGKTLKPADAKTVAERDFFDALLGSKT